MNNQFCIPGLTFAIKNNAGRDSRRAIHITVSDIKTKSPNQTLTASQGSRATIAVNHSFWRRIVVRPEIRTRKSRFIKKKKRPQTIGDSIPRKVSQRFHVPGLINQWTRGWPILRATFNESAAPKPRPKIP